MSIGIDNNRRGRSEGYESCLYSGEEVRILKEQNEAMQAELMNVKNELSQLRDQMPSLMQTMMHSMIHNIPPPPPPSTSSMVISPSLPFIHIILHKYVLTYIHQMHMVVKSIDTNHDHNHLVALV